MDVEALTRQAEAKAAPTPLVALQGFANTIDVETGVDLLATSAGLAEWLKASGLVRGPVKVSEGELERARSMRAAIRDLMRANSAGGEDRTAAAELGRHATDHPAPLTSGEADPIGLDLSPATRVDDVLAQLLGIVFQAGIAGEWPRLKLCLNPDCEWAFYDRSRNRGGSWCRIGLCGNRLKNRRYRTRLRESNLRNDA